MHIQRIIPCDGRDNNLDACARAKLTSRIVRIHNKYPNRNASWPIKSPVRLSSQRMCVRVCLSALPLSLPLYSILLSLTLPHSPSPSLSVYVVDW